MRNKNHRQSNEQNMNVINSKQLLGQLNCATPPNSSIPIAKSAIKIGPQSNKPCCSTTSSGGLQPWKFIVVTDPAVRAKLLPASYGQAQIADASHLVVFAAKKNFNEADVDAFINHTA